MEDLKIVATFDGIDHRALPLDLDGECYHNSWKWLMPVYEKIGELYIGKYEDDMYSYLFTINRLHSFIRKIGDESKPPFIQILVDEDNSITSLDATYKVIVEFVKWYNNQ